MRGQWDISTGRGVGRLFCSCVSGGDGSGGWSWLRGLGGSRSRCVGLAGWGGWCGGGILGSRGLRLLLPLLSAEEASEPSLELVNGIGRCCYLSACS